MVNFAAQILNVRISIKAVDRARRQVHREWKGITFLLFEVLSANRAALSSSQRDERGVKNAIGKATKMPNRIAVPRLARCRLLRRRVR